MALRLNVRHTVMAFCLIASQVFLGSNSAQASACKELFPLTEIDKQTYAYKGLTKQGIEALKRARNTIRDRETLFENEIRGLTTIHHGGLVARLYKGNMFLYGPPGGAKSMFVDWLMSGEAESPFKLQMHQMISEQALIGGQNFEAAKEGRFEVNTKGSATDHVTVLIDESDKANPAATAAVLSLLNERKVLAGSKVIDARTETVFSTSNANLPEILQQFVEGGQGSTGPALLNRFQIKAFVYNWLKIEDQAILDTRRDRKRYLKSIAKTHPEVLKDEVFMKPEVLNWEEMRELANSMFKLGDHTENVLRRFINDMREQTNRAVRESEERHRQSPFDEPFVYFPSIDFTERIRQQITEFIILSAFVDFMRSPLADDANIQALIKKPIELDPLSIWRGFLVMTTLGPGETRLKLKAADGDQKVDIDFGWTVDPSSARDKREEHMILNLKAEQERFRRTFLKYIEDASQNIHLAARNFRNKPNVENSISFEAMLLNSQGE